VNGAVSVFLGSNTLNIDLQEKTEQPLHADVEGSRSNSESTRGLYWSAHSNLMGRQMVLVGYEVTHRHPVDKPGLVADTRTTPQIILGRREEGLRSYPRNFRLEAPSTDQPQKQIPSRTFIALICLTMLGQSASAAIDNVIGNWRDDPLQALQDDGSFAPVDLFDNYAIAEPSI